MTLAPDARRRRLACVANSVPLAVYMPMHEVFDLLEAPSRVIRNSRAFIYRHNQNERIRSCQLPTQSLLNAKRSQPSNIWRLPTLVSLFTSFSLQSSGWDFVLPQVTPPP